MAQRLRRTPKPVTVLLVVSALSLLARMAWIELPCHTPCRTASDHTLVFDEAYYVNAARVIAGITPPAGQRYRGSPLGDDPNAEHPQLAKLVMAGSIELLGDGPWAWRLGSLLAGTLAIIGMFVLVRAAGGGDRLALGAATLMAVDNLLLVHGRIGTLDVYAVAAMIWGVALYLRRRPWAAGAVLGIGACCKLVAPYALFALVLLELVALLAQPRSRAALREAGARLGACVVAFAAVLLGLLAPLDRIAPPYDAVSHRLVSGDPFAHLRHILSYAAQQTTSPGPSGIASYPWGWLVDFKPIVYLNINPAHPAHGLGGIHPAVHFLGMISPPILLVAIPALALLSGGLIRAGASTAPDRTRVVAVVWVAGTFLPFVVLSLGWHRTSYLYYMVVVMPGLYVTAAVGARWLARAHRRIFALWVFAVAVAVVLMYPFTPLP